MPDEIVRKAKAGNAIFNGSIIVSIGERAHLDPPVVIEFTQRLTNLLLPELIILV